MSDTPEQTDLLEWEIVRREDIERSDDESIETINDESFSSMEEESSGEREEENRSVPENRIATYSRVGPLQLQTVEQFYGVYNLYVTLESITVIIAISSVAFAVGALLLNDYGHHWGSVSPFIPYKSLNLVLSELKHYQTTNQQLAEHINLLQKAVLDFKTQKPPDWLSKNLGDLSKTDIKEVDILLKAKDEIVLKESIRNTLLGDKEETSFAESGKYMKVKNIDVSIYEKYTNSSINSTSQSVNNLIHKLNAASDDLRLIIKEDIDYLKNKVAQNILKNSLRIKTKLLSKICSLNSIELISREYCLDNVPGFEDKIRDFEVNAFNSKIGGDEKKILSDEITAIIMDVAKDSAFSWLEVFDFLFEKKLNKISEILKNQIKINEDLSKLIQLNQTQPFSEVKNEEISLINNRDLNTDSSKDTRLPKIINKINNILKDSDTHNSNNNKKYKNHQLYSTKEKQEKVNKIKQENKGNKKGKIKSKEKENGKRKLKNNNPKQDFIEDKLKKEKYNIKEEKYKNTKDKKSSFFRRAYEKVKENVNTFVDKIKSKASKFKQKFKDLKFSKDKNHCNCKKLLESEHKNYKEIKKCKCKQKNSIKYDKDGSWFFNLGNYRSNVRSNPHEYHFDRTKWKILKSNNFKGKDKMDKDTSNLTCSESLQDCSAKFDFDRDGTWFLNMGEYRSGARWEQSRGDWQFDRAKGRRARKSS